MDVLLDIRNLLLDFSNQQFKLHCKNPLNRVANKGFSQTDEDGITTEICARLGLQGQFAEFGVSHGYECNTLILLAQGWRGLWVDGMDLAISLENQSRLQFKKRWVTLDNLNEILGPQHYDLISMDLDGNDLHFVKHILQANYRPKVWIVEYNAKFLPPAKFCIDYDPQHQWQGDDWFGASLQSYADLFTEHDYTLVACNHHTGANAWFVCNTTKHKFADVPTDIKDLYMPPRYYLPTQYGHQLSRRAIEQLLK